MLSIPATSTGVRPSMSQRMNTSDEHLLRDVLRFVFIAAKPNGPTEDDGPISCDERSERTFAPLTRSRDEFRRLGNQSGKTGHHMNEPARRLIVYLGGGKTPALSHHRRGLAV